MGDNKEDIQVELDELVRDTTDALASEVNNRGIEGQVKWLEEQGHDVSKYKANMPLTSEEYAGLEGNECPSCKHKEVETTGGFEADGGYGWQNCTCGDCGFVWQDRYKLEGYDSFT
ncbi:MAG: hypothetical protein KAR06_04455 [Deltaproteobacteria bacterium]|nr:hypothetical protein [Deltaproteobacteria bacterium]